MAGLRPGCTIVCAACLGVAWAPVRSTEPVMRPRAVAVPGFFLPGRSVAGVGTKSRGYRETSLKNVLGSPLLFCS